MQEFQYKMLEDETFAVTGYSGEEKEVIIPDTHWGKPVTVLFDSLFSGHAEIENVQIPDTVTDMLKVPLISSYFMILDQDYHNTNWQKD